ncbi:PH domain-containing protein [Gemmatimonas groenlandica]|uniref:PH domain-containing protein n=1 Tax=Gemmatimonas groenlandica TaxID=2732249 RepID=A0A6M4IRG7_9BACT|nr:PH domain-containing protein [Gemmatimonas groenlandica]QJR35442.1 PH domain-containing protein [Gemmatimonas groenlandica]
MSLHERGIGERSSQLGRATASGRSFRSVLDGWVVALVLVPTGFALLMVLLEAGLTSRRALVAAALVLGGGVLLPAVLYAVTLYQFTDTALLVRVGPFTTRVPYATIRSIEPSRDMSSAPAFSLDRLRVEYGDGQHVLISPMQRESFVELLATHRRAVAALPRST